MSCCTALAAGGPGKILDLRQPVPGKDDHQAGKAEKQRELQQQLATIPQQQPALAGEQNLELGKPRRMPERRWPRHHPRTPACRSGKVSSTGGLCSGSSIGADNRLFDIDQAGVISGAMLAPGGAPAIRRARLEAIEELIRPGDGKIMGQQLRRAVEDEPAP